MNRGKRLAIVSAFLLIGMVFYAAFPLAAHADDTTPQPPPPTDTSTPVPDGSSNQSAPTDVAVQPIATDTPAPSSADVPPLPSGTNVVVVDSSGNVVPLATSSAATIISSGDPIWCPSGVAPSAGVGGCTASSANLSSLISSLGGGAQPNVDGTIWITNGTDTSGGTISMDGSSLSTWATHSVVVQGGWDGTTSGNISGLTTLNANLHIFNWANDVSLNDLIFNNSWANVQTTGKISLKDLEARNSLGVFLTNLTGLNTAVSVTNSNFHNNSSNGLVIQSTGAVTLTNVVANSNALQGANIFSTSGAVTINQGSFSFNADDGLNVLAGGAVKLSHVTADNNNSVSVSHAGTWLATSGGDVSIDNSSFSSNRFDGLYAMPASGSVNLTNVNANSNGSGGPGLASAYLAAGPLGNVNISTGSFSNNAGDGLWAQAGGSISLSNVTVDTNDTTAVNHAAAFLESGLTGNITINTGSFNNNRFDGLQALAGGSINLSNVSANGNDSSGHDHASAFLESGPTGNITVSTGSFSGNGWDGLEAHSGGSISLSNVTADNNDTSGHDHASAFLTSGPSGDVSINTGSFSNNKWDGLQVLAGGQINLNGVTANSNDSVGHDFASAHLVSGPAHDVFIANSSFNNNGWDGLQVFSGREIDLTAVNANTNNGIGVTNAGALLISGPGGNINIYSGSFSDNAHDGLHAISNGGMYMRNVIANGNDVGGVNQAGTVLVAVGDIVIQPTSSFSNNYNDGLRADSSTGSISLSGVTANGNNISGLTVAGTDLTVGLTGSISIDHSAFDLNYHDGLNAVAGGPISLLSVSASGNGLNGSTAAGANLVSNSNIGISYGTFSNNRRDGLHATTLGTITVTNTAVDANNIGGFLQAGAFLVANGGIGLGSDSFSNNYYNGLQATSANDINLTNVVADSNNRSGGGTTGTNLSAGGNITIDPSSFSKNKHVGLTAAAGGSITLDQVTASNNGAQGIVAASAGQILMNKVIAVFNGGDGVNLTSGSNIDSTCGSFQVNGGYGINANLPGTLTLNGDTGAGNALGNVNVAGGGNLVSNGNNCFPGEKEKKTPTPVVASGGAAPTPAVAATPAPAPQLNVLNVTDGQTVNLDCTAYAGTTLALSNRDQIILLCPVTGQATLKHVAVDALPSKLDSTMTYQSAMDAEVTQSGQTVTTLNGPMKVDFVIPANVQGTTQLSILHWDGTKWVDVGGTATPDGFIETITNQTGTFVLVSH